MYNEKYEGDFVEDKRHGKGTYTYSDRSPAKKYVGDFRNEIKHGFGTATYRDGSKYVGEFKNRTKFNSLAAHVLVKFRAMPLDLA